MTKLDQYQTVIEQAITTGTYDGFGCVDAIAPTIRLPRSDGRAVSCADVFSAGYGTNCWDDSNTNPDPACAIPALTYPTCNGGFYRIPIAITIFECQEWTGTNYLETAGGGFEALSDVDLTTKLVELNELYANSNIEFYEAKRQRIQDCDLYDFYQNGEPNSGVNDALDDLSETVIYDDPNAINLFFVGGIEGDHDCCGAMGFAPYPPSRAYSVLRYGTGVMGSNIAHEIGHIFGLPHTYAETVDFPVPDGDGVPTGSLDNCDCLTQGDRICDTWPDPRLSHNCDHEGGAMGACYIKMEAEDFCGFDKDAYAEHITTSHPAGTPITLTISPNAGTVFSSTSSTVLTQNIMSNNFIFGCTTTFSPCQYKKIHEVARADCRVALCTNEVTDYFSTTTTNAANSPYYEICVGDAIPTFQAGKNVTRFDGSTYSLSCFNWFLTESDLQAEAILTNSAIFTPTADQIDVNTAGTYEFWISEVNALNDPPCKTKVTIKVFANPGIATVDGTNEAITTCASTIYNLTGSGASIADTTNMIGWYFSETNPTTTLTTAESIHTALTTATNGHSLNATTGNIIQSTSGSPLTILDSLTIDCPNLEGADSTYFLTPFIAAGETVVACSSTGGSTSFNWNVAGGSTGGATIKLGPATDCAAPGLELTDYTLTIQINDCEAIGGNVGAKIYFNCGSELSIATPFDFTFDCADTLLTISRAGIESINSDFNPLTDQICINFINTNFFLPNFEGDIAVSMSAKLDATYSGATAQSLWDALGVPTIDTSNLDCFWGTPIQVNCDCSHTPITTTCPTIGNITGEAALCAGDTTTTLRVDGLTDMDTFGIRYVYFTNPQTAASSYHAANGILGTIPIENLTNNDSVATLETVHFPTVAGTYYVYAILHPTPADTLCRPSQGFQVTINAFPSAPTIIDAIYCQGDSAAILTAVGENLLWYDTAVGGIGNTIAPIPATHTVGIQNYWVSQTINNCESPRSMLTITINEQPSAPSILDTAYCQGDSAAILTAIGENLLWYDTAVGGTGSAIAPTPVTAMAGIQHYWVSQTVNNCESPRSMVTVTINAIPTAPTVVDLPQCEGDTLAMLTAVGDNLLWYDTALSGIASSIAPTPLANLVGIQSYWVSQTVNTCESPRSILTVTVDARPEAPLVEDLFYNKGDTALVLTAIGEQLLWYTEAVGGVGSELAPTPTTDTIGVQSYWVTQTIDICESLRSRLTVTINDRDTTAAPQIEDIVYCQGDTATALTAMGTNLLWYTNADGGTGSAIAPIPTTDSIGTQTYWVSQTINSIESPRSMLTITITGTPSVPIGSDTMYCEGATAVTLTAIGENLRWYDTVTGGTGSTIAPTPRTDTIGIQNYWVAQVAATCIGPRTLISVTVTPTAAAPQVLDIAYCQGDSAVMLNAIGTNLLWYDTAVGGIGNTIAPSPITAVAGMQNYWVSQTINNCESPRAMLTVTVNPTPTAPIVSDTMYCEGELSVQLTAIGENLLWYTSATTGIGSTEASTPNTGVTGTRRYWVTQTINGCESPRSRLRVVVTPMIEIGLGSPIHPSTCGGADGRITIVAGLIPFRDYMATYFFNGVQIIDTLRTDVTGNFRLNNLTAGNYTDITILNNGCPSNSLSQELSDPAGVTAASLAFRDSITSICQGDSIDLFLTVTGGQAPYTLVYTDGISTDTLLTDTTVTSILVKPTDTTTYTILAASDASTCTGITNSDVIVLAVNEQPLPPTTVDQVYCIADIEQPLIASGENLLWYRTATGGSGSDKPFIVDTFTPGDQFYWVSQTVHGCESERAILSVNVVITPDRPIVTDTMYCVGEVAAPLAAIGENLRWYTESPTDTGVLVAPIPSTTVAGEQNFFVNQMVNGCRGNSERIQITINPIPAPPIVVDTIYCQGETAVELTAIGENLRWYTNESGGTSTAIAPTINTNQLGVASYWVSQTINGCESDRANLSITVNPAVTLVMGTISNPSTCSGADGNMVLTGLIADTDYTLTYTYEGNSQTDAITTNSVGSFILNNLTAGNYTNIQVSLNGCTSNSLDQQLNDPGGSTAASLEILNGIDTICTGSTIHLGATITGGQAPYTLIYSDGVVNDTILNYISGEAFAVTPVATTTYSLLTIIDDNECIGTMNSASVTLTLKEIPSAPTVTEQTLCLGSTAIPLTAIGENLQWYETATGGIGTTVAPSPMTTVLSTQQYWVSQTIDGCESGRALLMVTIQPQPEPPAIADINICEGAAIVSIMDDLPNLLWYDSETGGVGSVEPPMINTAQVGMMISWVSQTIDGCESTRTPVRVSVNPLPAIPVIHPVNYCIGDAPLPLTAGGNNLLWYDSLADQTGSTIAPTPSTDTVGTQMYWVSQTVNGCESAHALITASVTATPEPPITTNSTYCKGATATGLTAEGEALKWYTSATDTLATDILIPETEVEGTQTYWVSQTINGCESERAITTVTINPAVTIGLGTVRNPSSCSGNDGRITLTGLAANTEYLLSYTFEGMQVTGTIVTDTTVLILDNLSAGSYTDITVDIEGCISNSVSQDLNDPGGNTSATLAINNDTICGGQGATINASITGGQAPYTLIYSNGTITDTLLNYESGTAIIVNPNVTTTYSIIAITDANACIGVSSADAVTLTVNPFPAPPTVMVDTTICTGGTAAPLSASGENLMWYEVATGGTGTTTAPTPITTSVGTQAYWVSQTVNGCESDRAKVTVTINSSVSMILGTATNPSTCSGTDGSITLTGLLVNTEYILRYTIEGIEQMDTIQTGATNSYTIANLSAGIYTGITLEVGGCRSNSLSQELSDPGEITSTTLELINDVVCSGEEATFRVNITGGQAPYTLIYTDATENDTIFNYESGEVITVTPSTTTTYSLVTITDANACTGVSSANSLTLTVTNVPAMPTVTNAAFCTGDVAAPLSAVGENLQWYEAATGGTGTNTAPTPVTSIATTQEYWVSQTVNGCESARALISITIHPIPAAPIAMDVTYRLNETTIALDAQGEQLRWYTTATGGIASTTAPIPTTAIAGTQTFWVSQTINSCESARTPIDVTVIETPVVTLGATINPTNGSNGVIQITGLRPNVSYTLTYQQNGVPVSIAINADATGNYVISNLPAGSYTNITVSLDGIASNSLNVALVQDDTCSITAILTGTNSICVGQSAVLSTTISGGSGPYTLILTDGTNNFTHLDYTSGRTILFAPSFTTTYRVVSIEDRDDCLVTGDDTMGIVEVQVSNPPAAPSVTNIAYCTGTQAAELSAVGTNLLWYTTATGGTGSTTAPSPNTTITGTQTYWVSQSVGSCESVRVPLTVTIQDTPNKPVVNNLNYCQGATPAPLQAQGSNLLWYVAPEGTNGSSTPPTPTTALHGIYHYWVSQTINGCESERAQLTITVEATMSPPQAQDVTYCIGDIPSPLVAYGKNLRWYTTASGGTGTTVAPTPKITYNTQIYWVSQGSGVCESARTKIIVTTHQQPEPPIIVHPNPVYCEGEAVGTPAVIGEHIRWYTQATGGTSTSTPTPPITTVGFQDCWVTQTINGCESARTPFTLTIKKTPQLRIGMVIEPSVCGEDGAIQLKGLQANQAYQLTYTRNGVPTEPIAITTSATGTYILQALKVGNYEAIQVQLGDCSSAPLQQTLSNGQEELVGWIVGTSPICQGTNAVLAVTIQGGVPPYTLRFTNDRSIYTLTDYTSNEDITVLPMMTTTYSILGITDSNGCKGTMEESSATVEVNTCFGIDLNGNTEQARLKIYPNPIQSELFLAIEGLSGQAGRVRLLSQSGQVVRAMDLQALSAANGRMDVRQLPRGLYFVQVQLENGVFFVEKVVME